MMSVDTICERKNIIKKLWNRNKDQHVCGILLKQLNNDITYFLHDKLPDDIEKELRDLSKEINE